jgi:hypothetical protein
LFQNPCPSLRKSVKQQHFSEQTISDVKVNQLINKIKLAVLPATGRPGFEVKVKMKDGSELVGFASSGKGDPMDSPLSDAEIIAKHRSQVVFSGTVSGKGTEKLLNLLKTLEDLDNVGPLVDLAIKK